MCHDGSTSSLTLATGLGSAFRKRTPSAHLLFYYDFAPFPGGGVAGSQVQAHWEAPNPQFRQRSSVVDMEQLGIHSFDWQQLGTSRAGFSSDLPSPTVVPGAFWCGCERSSNVLQQDWLPIICICHTMAAGFKDGAANIRSAHPPF